MVYGCVNAQRGGLICDLGNVIIAYWLSSITLNTFHAVDYDKIPEVPDAFEILRRLAALFEGNITVVYNATDVAENKISGWLLHHKFSERTGIPSSRIVRSKRGRDKTLYLNQSSASFCGTTIVVDDRLEVLGHFIGKVPYLFLFRPQKAELAQFNKSGALNRVQVVRTWGEILDFVQRLTPDQGHPP